MADNDNPAPDALLLLTPQCPHCPTVLQGLGELVKTGRIGRLEVVNLQVRPEVGQRLGVRSVPWLRLGPFELEGLRSPTELARWAERAGSTQGMADYLAELLASGRLDQATEQIQRDPANTEALLLLLGDPDTELTVRIGISAILEGLAGTDLLRSLVEPLGALSRHEEARIRHDACHYLGLSASPAALPYLQQRLEDGDPGVVEAAQEALEYLGEAGIRP
jgi:hypothetical protein